jgi:putative serine protease PepD
LLPVAALVAAGLLGGAISLAGASALGVGGKTTTVRQIEPALAGNSPTSFETARPRKALTINQIFRRDAPGVVQVTSTQVVRTSDPFDFGLPQTEEQKALGSGFVMDKAGHIVTNYHVVAGARTVEVSFSNSDNMKAKIVGSDPSTDLAVLQIDARSRALQPLPFGDSDHVRVGDSVVAIGNPLGYDRSVTAGIVSAVQRAISAPNQYPIDHVIQTDAPINHGNSGGPLIDSRGHVIGVNAQIATGDSGSDGNIGIGFAIPINTVRTVVAQLIRKGKVEHAFIGITAKPVTPEIARLFRPPGRERAARQRCGCCRASRWERDRRRLRRQLAGRRRPDRLGGRGPARFRQPASRPDRGEAPRPVDLARGLSRRHQDHHQRQARTAAIFSPMT